MDRHANGCTGGDGLSCPNSLSSLSCYLFRYSFLFLVKPAAYLTCIASRTRTDQNGIAGKCRHDHDCSVRHLTQTRSYVETFGKRNISLHRRQKDSTDSGGTDLTKVDRFTAASLSLSLSISLICLVLSLSLSLSLSLISLSLSLCLPAYLSFSLSLHLYFFIREARPTSSPPQRHVAAYCVQREAPDDVDVVTGNVRRDQDIVNNIGRNEGGKFWATKAPNFWTESRRPVLPWRTLSGRSPTKCS